MSIFQKWFSQRRSLKRIEEALHGNVIAKSFGVLTRKEKVNFSYVIVIQIFLGLLDLASVAIIGLLGSLAITGVSNTGPGDRLTSFLRVFGLDDNSLKSQMIYLALLSGVLLVFKTCVSLYFTRKTLYFLARRSAQLSSILISNLLRLPILKIQERPVHETIYSLTGGVNSITVGILGSFSALITDLSLLVLLLGGLFIVDTTIAISALNSRSNPCPQTPLFV
jgi:ABC-type multidrug transport system fused ATPase/permease subunit